MKVLYVDDDEDLRELGLLALGLDGALETRTVDGAASALILLDSDAWRPDILLLDVMMPDMDGRSLLREIRKRRLYLDTPAIFLTARAQPADLAGYGDAGVCGVITKPFDPLTLAARLRGLVDGRMT
jgi:CheY-like chemotaxis protein